jgi:predicted MFS family arabinose efflux permease
VGFLGTFAMTILFPYLGIYALKGLGASQNQLALTFIVAAVLAAAGGYTAGHLSDRIGRRRVLLAGWLCTGIVPLGLAFVGHHVLIGLAFVAAYGASGSLGDSAGQALIADLVPPDKQALAYASERVAENLGVCFGPPVGALLLLTHHWRVLFLTVVALVACVWMIAYRLIPLRGSYAPKQGMPRPPSFAVIRRDRRFQLFLAFNILASMTYVGFDSVFAISLTGSHGFSPSQVGLVLVVNPILITFTQVRLTRRLRHLSPAIKLAAAMPLMGLPFLLLAVSDSLPIVAILVLVFVVGEMLWVPSAQTVVAGLAPAEIRGAYMGFYGGTFQVAWALTPFFGLQIRHSFGDLAMWIAIAAVSVLASAAGAFAARGPRVAAAVASASE